jgi:hypothetical protein
LLLYLSGTLMTGKNLTPAQVAYIRQQHMQQLNKQRAAAEGVASTTTTTRTVTGVLPFWISFSVAKKDFSQPQPLLEALPPSLVRKQPPLGWRHLLPRLLSMLLLCNFIKGHR